MGGFFLVRFMQEVCGCRVSPAVLPVCREDIHPACNFLSEVYTVTNVKELSEEEIIAIIDRNGNVKASH